MDEEGGEEGGRETERVKIRERMTLKNERRKSRRVKEASEQNRKEEGQKKA